MLDIGFSELLIILGVALIVLGPKKLPELARSLGRGLAELRRTSDDLRRSILMEEEAVQRPGKESKSLRTSTQPRPDPASDKTQADSPARDPNQAASRQGSPASPKREDPDEP